MIEKTASFKTTDGSVHATIQAAQAHEINSIFASVDAPELAIGDRAVIASFIITKRESFLAILGVKPRKPRTVKKPRTPKPVLVGASK